MKFSHAPGGDRIAHFTGRHKPVHGGLAAAVQAADTREMSNPDPLQEVRLSFMRNQYCEKDLTNDYSLAIERLVGFNKKEAMPQETSSCS